jgi:hypothetical protein
MSASLFTALHVALSVIGLIAGFAVLDGLMRSRLAAGTTALFLLTTAAASVTGFLFHSGRFGIGHVTGLISLLVLMPTVLGLYRFRLAGPWRWIFAGGAVALLYLNMVIAVLQAFGKIALLRGLITGPTDLLFLAVQLALLAGFVALGARATRRFRPSQPFAPRRAADAPFGRSFPFDHFSL